MRTAERLFSQALDRGSGVELKERREANDCANSEFNRVKRAKLENERARSRARGVYDEKAEKQLDRERANRASAAASRAKIVCYARELEKRTDRLERDRNAHALRAERSIKKLGVLREETKKLKGVLRSLWELKDPKTCSYLVDSNALFLLASNAEEQNDDEDLKIPHGVSSPAVAAAAAAAANAAAVATTAKQHEQHQTPQLTPPRALPAPPSLATTPTATATVPPQTPTAPHGRQQQMVKNHVSTTGVPPSIQEQPSASPSSASAQGGVVSGSLGVHVVTQHTAPRAPTTQAPQYYTSTLPTPPPAVSASAGTAVGAQSETSSRPLPGRSIAESVGGKPVAVVTTAATGVSVMAPSPELHRPVYPVTHLVHASHGALHGALHGTPHGTVPARYAAAPPPNSVQYTSAAAAGANGVAARCGYEYAPAQAAAPAPCPGARGAPTYMLAPPLPRPPVPEGYAHHTRGATVYYATHAHPHATSAPPPPRPTTTTTATAIPPMRVPVENEISRKRA